MKHKSSYHFQIHGGTLLCVFFMIVKIILNKWEEDSMKIFIAYLVNIC